MPVPVPIYRCQHMMTLAAAAAQMPSESRLPAQSLYDDDDDDRKSISWEEDFFIDRDTEKYTLTKHRWLGVDWDMIIVWRPRSSGRPPLKDDGYDLGMFVGYDNATVLKFVTFEWSKVIQVTIGLIAPPERVEEGWVRLGHREDTGADGKKCRELLSQPHRYTTQGRRDERTDFGHKPIIQHEEFLDPEFRRLYMRDKLNPATGKTQEYLRIKVHLELVKDISKNRLKARQSLGEDTINKLSSTDTIDELTQSYREIFVLAPPVCTTFPSAARVAAAQQQSDGAAQHESYAAAVAESKLYNEGDDDRKSISWEEDFFFNLDRDADADADYGWFHLTKHRWLGVDWNMLVDWCSNDKKKHDMRMFVGYDNATVLEFVRSGWRKVIQVTFGLIAHPEGKDELTRDDETGADGKKFGLGLMRDTHRFDTQGVRKRSHVGRDPALFHNLFALPMFRKLYMRDKLNPATGRMQTFLRIKVHLELIQDISRDQVECVYQEPPKDTSELSGEERDRRLSEVNSKIETASINLAIFKEAERYRIEWDQQTLYKDPFRFRLKVRKNIYRSQTSGQCRGFAQANLIILPRQYSFDFLLFCFRNPKSCPLLHVIENGEYLLEGTDIDVRTDVPKYRVYVNGSLREERFDIVDIWRRDFVTFVIGCSFSFEDAIVRQGYRIRHIEEGGGKTVPMYRTNIPCSDAGIFKGNFMVVSMRPFRSSDVVKIVEITSRFPKVHGSPVHIGNPADIGIFDIGAPDFGDPVTLTASDVCVFWACGVTPQAAVMSCSTAINICISHSPGHMLVLDTPNEQLTFL